MKIKFIGLVVIGVGAFILSKPGVAAIQGQQKKVWVFSRALLIDPKIWSYYAPGSLKPRGVLPLNETDGILIKRGSSEKDRDVILIRGEPLTRDLGEVCKLFVNKFRKGELNTAKKECLVTEKRDGGKKLVQWVYQDFRSLKQVSFAFSYSKGREVDAFKDWEMIKKGMAQ